jgi:hypothetical protein
MYTFILTNNKKTCINDIKSIYLHHIKITINNYEL